MTKTFDWAGLAALAGHWAPRVAILLLIVAGGLIGASLAQSMILRWGQKLGIADIQWVATATRWAIVVATGLVALQHLGINVGLLTTLLAVVAGAIAGSVALALALGGKAIVGDILGAYHLKKLFHPGQTLKVAGYTGVLREITPTGLILENDEGQIYVSGETAFEGVVVRLRDDK